MNYNKWVEILRQNNIFGWLSIAIDEDDEENKAAFCPFCGNKNVTRCENEYLKSFLADETVLLICTECESLFGRYT
jgi:hypothetical protein